MATNNQTPPKVTNDPHRRVIGRIALVDRVRGGKIQIRHMVTAAVGFKIQDGQLVKMTPQERRTRKRAARISARKRRGEQSQINRNTKISMRKRNARFG